MKNTKIVYFHIRKDSGEVFYVGIGNPDRAYDTWDRSIFWKRIVNKVGYNIEIIHTGLSLNEAIQYERKYIKKFGRRDLGLGNLVNMTDGGEGNQNQLFNEETRMKMSESHMGEKHHMWGKNHRLESNILNASTHSGFNVDDIINIRTLYSKGEKSRKEIAHSYEVNIQVIHRIITRQYWSLIPKIEGEITSKRDWLKKYHTELPMNKVQEIKKTFFNGIGGGYKRFAEKYGVSISVIRRIVNKDIDKKRIPHKK